MLRHLVLFSAVLAVSLSGNTTENKPLPEKVISITINENGFAISGRDTLPLVELAEEIHLRLWKSYLGTGKMPDRIVVKYLGTGVVSHKGETEKAIKEGQQKALQELCVQKHKKRYEDISDNQKSKVKKQYPVLFQENFSEAG